MSTPAPRADALPPWTALPRTCAVCRADLPADRRRHRDVELRRVERDGIAVVLMGSTCQLCRERMLCGESLPATASPTC
jgi:hypothetical protein